LQNNGINSVVLTSKNLYDIIVDECKTKKKSLDVTDFWSTGVLIEYEDFCL